MQSKFLSGRDICEKWGISLEELAGLCHSGELTAYRLEDRLPVLASSQCNTKFKFSGNTVFTIHEKILSGILAVSQKSASDFKVFTDKKINESELQENIYSKKKNGICECSRATTARFMKGRRELRIKHTCGEYVLYYNIYAVNRLDRRCSHNFSLNISGNKCKAIRLYSSEKIFFEANHEGTFEINFLELKNNLDCGIGVHKTLRIHVSKICDSIGEKFIVDEYDTEEICIEKNVFVCKICGVYIDVRKKNRCEKYLNEYEKCCVFLQQHAVDYFAKEDVMFSNPLKHFLDFFIFDYNEYKKRFYPLIDEHKSRYIFFRYIFFKYIGALEFDAEQFSKSKTFAMSVIQIRNDPKAYMLERCCELLAKCVENDNNSKIIRAYKLAFEGNGKTWVEIDKIVWPESEEEISETGKKRSRDSGDVSVFINKKHKLFEVIARKNDLPFVRASELRGMSEETKPRIADEMIRQLDQIRGKQGSEKNGRIQG